MMHRHTVVAAAGIVALVVVTLAGSAGAMSLAAQQDALVGLYTSTNGSQWRNSANWLQGSACENGWFGVFCDAAGQNVRSVVLVNNSLSGTLPSNIGDLSGLGYGARSFLLCAHMHAIARAHTRSRARTLAHRVDDGCFSVMRRGGQAALAQRQ
jgi:hypothetical protein